MRKSPLPGRHQARQSASTTSLLQLAGGSFVLTSVHDVNESGQTALHMVCLERTDDEVSAAALIRRGADINAKDFCGRTPLHVAAEYGNVGICDVLLDCGAKVSSRAEDGSTPLHAFLKRTMPMSLCALRVLTRLLDKGKLMNTLTYRKERRRESLLQTACARNQVYLTAFLLDNNADITQTTESGANALHYTVGTGDLKLTALILAAAIKQGVDTTAMLTAPDRHGLTPMSGILANAWSIALQPLLPPRLFKDTLKADCKTDETTRMYRSTTQELRMEGSAEAMDAVQEVMKRFGVSRQRKSRRRRRPRKDKLSEESSRSSMIFNPDDIARALGGRGGMSKDAEVLSKVLGVQRLLASFDEADAIPEFAKALEELGSVLKILSVHEGDGVSPRKLQGGDGSDAEDGDSDCGEDDASAGKRRRRKKRKNRSRSGESADGNGPDSDGSEKDKKKRKEEETAEQSAPEGACEITIAVAPPSEPAPAPPSGQSDAQERFDVSTMNSVKELISSEERVMQHMETLYMVYVEPFRRESYLSKEDHACIFSNVDEVRDVFVLFDRRLRDWSESPEKGRPLLGHVMLQMAQKLNKFKLFCRNFESALEHMEYLESKHKKFSSFLDNGRELSGLTLNSYLIMPIQRVMRYPMLLQRILKHLPENHVEYEKLLEAYGAYRKYADLIDQDKHEAKRRKELEHINSRFKSLPESLELVTPNRVLAFSSVLAMPEDDVGPHPSYMGFLFNDMLLLAKDTKKPRIPYRYVTHCPLKDGAIFSLPDYPIFGASSSSNDALNRLENAFQLVYSEVGSERPKSMTFIAEDAQQKEVWMKNLSRCILAFKRREVQKEVMSDTLVLPRREGPVMISTLTANTLTSSPASAEYREWFVKLKGKTLFLFDHSKSSKWQSLHNLNFYDELLADPIERTLVVWPSEPTMEELGQDASEKEYNEERAELGELPVLTLKFSGSVDFNEWMMEINASLGKRRE